jgi:hypothetical protein
VSGWLSKIFPIQVVPDRGIPQSKVKGRIIESQFVFAAQRARSAPAISLLGFDEDRKKTGSLDCSGFSLTPLRASRNIACSITEPGSTRCMAPPFSFDADFSGCRVKP